MALITKAGGQSRTHTEQTGTTVTSIALAAPGKGFANRIRAIFAVQTGGTSVQMIVNVQHNASAEDPTGVNINIARVARAAGSQSNYHFSGGKDAGFVGGENQQTTIGVSGNVNDSTETHLTIVADVVRV